MSTYVAVPTGRNLIVTKHEAQEEARPSDSEFAGWEFPEEFSKTKKHMDRHELVVVVAIGEDVTEGKFYVGQTVLVETSMLETVSGPAGVHSFVGENYIPVKFDEE